MGRKRAKKRAKTPPLRAVRTPPWRMRPQDPWEAIVLSVCLTTGKRPRRRDRIRAAFVDRKGSPDPMGPIDVVLDLEHWFGIQIEDREIPKTFGELELVVEEKMSKRGTR